MNTYKHESQFSKNSLKKTDFGFQTISEEDKTRKVSEIFHSVASKYDVINDLISFGLHRFWKTFVISRASAKIGMKILDIAGGTGDLTKLFVNRVGSSGEVWLADTNDSMIKVGRDRLIDIGIITPIVVCNAESLPFPTGYFDRISLAFGLRNMTHKELALLELTRVLKPGGKILILEFSKVNKSLKQIYDWYSFNILPWLAKKAGGDELSYRYLVESIRVQPDQKTLVKMMLNAGLRQVRYFNLTSGIVALHEGFRPTPN